MYRVCDDPRIKASHISLFVTLIVVGYYDSEKRTIVIKPNSILMQAKISISTFRRCIHDLHDYGYLQYFPSFDPREKSKISLLVDEKDG